jgi:mRNA-degrading endonuclease YafQ of YafQ-DinJ toxin-antitoxin module
MVLRRSAYEKTLQLVELNPFHPSLRLHKLKGRHSDLHSVSINLSYRITIEFLIEGRTIIPVAIGSHDEVY